MRVWFITLIQLKMITNINMKIFKLIFWIFVLMNISNISFSNENFYNKGLEFFNEKKYEDARFMFEKSIVFNPKY